MKRIFIFIIVMTSAQARELKDHGVYGELFPIKEKSLLEVIKSKLQGLSNSGELEKHQRYIMDTAKLKLQRPTPVAGLTKTTMARTFTYDPSITVPYDLADHKGEVFHKKGTKVNLLDTHSLSRSLLFIDGDDAEQITWAVDLPNKETDHHPKIILVKGSPLELSERLKIPVFFDQNGTLVKKLGITQVPAKVSQKDKVLEIEEIKLTEIDHD